MRASFIWQRVVWLTHVQPSLCVCVCVRVRDQLPEIASWCDADCAEPHKKWVKMRLLPVLAGPVYHYPNPLSPLDTPLCQAPGQRVSWWTSLRQKRKSYPLLLLLLLSASCASLSTVRTLKFSFGMRKNKFSFSCNCERATWFSSCVLRAAAACCCCCGPLLAASHFLSGRIFPIFHPVAISLCISFMKLLRDKLPACLSVWVGGCTRKWAKWACVRQVWKM